MTSVIRQKGMQRVGFTKPTDVQRREEIARDKQRQLSDDLDEGRLEYGRRVPIIRDE